MNGIENVLARIAEIENLRHTGVGHRRYFAPYLQSAVAKSAPPETGPDVNAGPDTGLMAATAGEIGAVRSYTTLGSLVGGGPPTTRVTYPDGAILSAGQLDHYLAMHRIEERNGRLQDHELTSVSNTWYGRGRLLPPAATAWEAMVDAAAADGITLKAIDTYRTWESQNRAYQDHLAGRKKANVLPPGTSQHGLGLAVDLTNGHIIGRDDPEWHWMQENAARFGYYPISNETWHWEFRGSGAS